MLFVFLFTVHVCYNRLLIYSRYYEPMTSCACVVYTVEPWPVEGGSHIQYRPYLQLSFSHTSASVPSENSYGNWSELLVCSYLLSWQPRKKKKRKIHCVLRWGRSIMNKTCWENDLCSWDEGWAAITALCQWPWLFKCKQTLRQQDEMWLQWGLLLVNCNRRSHESQHRQACCFMPPILP